MTVVTLDPLILAIDQGTTNTKAVLVDRRGSIVSQASRPMAIEYPRPGWVQQDAARIWQAVRECVDECLIAAGSPVVAAIGISNQRETGMAWERTSGQPVGPAVTWQCRRSAELCERLRAEGRGPRITALTGLPLDPMFTAGKLRWLLDQVPEGQARAAAGELCVGTVDSWLLWNLSGGARHRTDVSNASRTQLLDISAGAWDDELCEAFGVPASALPEVLPSGAIFGESVAVGTLPAGVPIGAMVGDSHAALFGHAGFADGSVKATYGTGSSLMMPTPTRLAAEGGLAATIAWGLEDIVYALEGNIYATGATVQWLAEFAGLDGPGAVAALATRVTDTGGVYLVPAFTGLGAPHWDDVARGLISGLTRGSSLAQLARAAIESIAYPDPRRLRCHADGQRRRPAGPAGRRRRHPQCPADAVPGGHPGRAGAAQQHTRALCHGRRLPGRSGHRGVGIDRGSRSPAPLRRSVRTGARIGRTRAPPRRLAGGRGARHPPPILSRRSSAEQAALAWAGGLLAEQAALAWAGGLPDARRAACRQAAQLDEVDTVGGRRGVAASASHTGA